MRRLLMGSVVVVSLLSMVSLFHAATNLNSSKSNIYRIVYPDSLVSKAQAEAILAGLDKTGRTVEEGQVVEILKKHGVQTKQVRKIVIIPADKPGKQNTVIILTDPADETQAREIAVSDSGVVAPKPVPKPIKK